MSIREVAMCLLLAALLARRDGGSLAGNDHQAIAIDPPQIRLPS